MSEQERNEADAKPDPQAEPGAREVETGDIEAVQEGGLPSPTADQFQEDKPAAEVNPPDKAATAAAESDSVEDRKAPPPETVQNAKPDVPAEVAPVPPAPEPSQVGGFQLAGGAARQTVADQRRAERAALAPIREEQERRGALSRRALMRAGFWTAMGMTIAGVGYCTKETLWPQNVEGFGGLIAIPANQVPTVDDPPQYFIKGKLWLANITAGEGQSEGFGEPSDAGGLLALYQKCPHLGCRVPYNPDFVFAGSVGWFRCPCHGSTYNKAGIRVFGPAPRPLSTMIVEVQDDGSLIVNTGDITPGADDNPNRAVPYDAAVFNRTQRRA